MRRLFQMLVAWLGVWAWPMAAQAADVSCPPQASYSPAVLAKAREQGMNRGFLWRVKRDGRSSYLYGTLHVGRAEWLSPGPAIQAALDTVDTVALEVDVTSAEAQQDMQAVGRRAPHTIAPELNKRLERLWLAECLPLAQLRSGPPELQAMALTTLMARRQGFDPGYSSELMLTLAARARKLPLVSLESMAMQLDLVLAADDAEADEAVAQIVQQLENEQARVTLIRLIDAWANHDLNVLATYGEWCECVKTDQERADMKRLLDDRNPGLADGIERLHAEGQRVFAAVGALHMTGPAALPQLLAARGFEVERLF
jgi:uncharacterized protein